jgi:hypothetical protein
MDETLVAAQWWKTAIVDIEPNKINIRGYPIQELIGSVSFVSIIWLMLRGDLPSADQATLLEAALVAGVDHGPQAPSIAIARMSATCGIGLNNAVASGINALGRYSRWRWPRVPRNIRCYCGEVVGWGCARGGPGGRGGIQASGETAHSWLRTPLSSGRPTLGPTSFAH